MVELAGGIGGQRKGGSGQGVHEECIAKSLSASYLRSSAFLYIIRFVHHIKPLSTTLNPKLL